MYPGIRRLLYFIFAFMLANQGDDVVSDALIPAKACPEEESSLLWYTKRIADRFGERLMEFLTVS